MAGLAEFRAQYPAYNDMSDGALAVALHKKFYSDIPMADYLGRVGVDRGDVLYEFRAPGDPNGDYLRQTLAAPATGETPEQAAVRQGGQIAERRAGFVEGIARNSLQGLTSAFGDEIVAAGAAALDPLVHGDRGKDYGQRYEAYLGRERGGVENFREDNPVAAFGSEIGGVVLSPLNAVVPGGGATTLLGRVAKGIGIGTGTSAAYGFGAGEGDAVSRIASALEAAKYGAAGGAALPVLSTGGRLVADALNKGVVQPIASAFNRENEAVRRIAGALEADRQVGAPMMTAADEAVAAQAGIPVLNADRGGETVRTLARSAANVSPQADSILKSVADDRFAQQSTRAVDFLGRLFNGGLDDVRLADGLRAAARQTNRPAYDRAYAAPGAKALWTADLQQMMQSDLFRKAVREAESVGTDMAALDGQRAVRSPFAFGADGSITLKALPGGGRALPNLEFWDVVQRNLREVADSARSSNNRFLAERAGQLRTQLLSTLDNAVPEFQQARAGAASFFGAEDAIEAGKMFARQPKSLPEARKAHAALTAPEREAFAIGFASELVDAIKASRDRTNVIEQVFGRQASREAVEVALGPQRAREVEAYVRAETFVDRLRTAVSGNSTTAKQLIAAGVLGGGVSALQGGSLSDIGMAAFAFGLGRKGLQLLGKRVDDQVMRRVAEILASGDPVALQQAVSLASRRADYMVALRAFGAGLRSAAPKMIAPMAAGAGQ